MSFGYIICKIEPVIGGETYKKDVRDSPLGEGKKSATARDC